MKINKHKGTNAARNIAARRYGKFKKINYQMKKLPNILIFLVILITSCEKEKDPNECQYLDGTIDTSLNISFEINNKQLIYYQKKTGDGGFSLLVDSTTNSEIWSYATFVEFDTIDPNSVNNNFEFPLSLVFYDFSVNDRKYDYFELAKYLKDTTYFLNFSSGVQIDFNDTIFMKGLSMRY